MKRKKSSSLKCLLCHHNTSHNECTAFIDSIDYTNDTEASVYIENHVEGEGERDASIKNPGVISERLFSYNASITYMSTVLSNDFSIYAAYTGLKRLGLPGVAPLRVIENDKIVTEEKYMK